MKLGRLIRKIRIRLGLYDLRAEGAKWVARNIGDEWVGEFLENYDNLNRGIPIGGFVETMIFMDMIERIKNDFADVTDINAGNMAESEVEIGPDKKG